MMTRVDSGRVQAESEGAAGYRPARPLKKEDKQEKVVRRSANTALPPVPCVSFCGPHGARLVWGFSFFSLV